MNLIGEVTEQHRNTIINGLRVAADTYHVDMQAARRRGDARLSEQFARQLSETAKLADAIEQGDIILS